MGKIEKKDTIRGEIIDWSQKYIEKMEIVFEQFVVLPDVRDSS